MANLFVYGTLLDEERIRGLLGRIPRSRSAVLRGFRKAAHPGGPWPAAEPDPSAAIHGKVYEGLSDGELERIDRYEGVPEGLYRRDAATVEVGNTRIEAWFYVKL